MGNDERWSVRPPHALDRDWKTGKRHTDAGELRLTCPVSRRLPFPTSSPPAAEFVREQVGGSGIGGHMESLPAGALSVGLDPQVFTHAALSRVVIIQSLRSRSGFP